MDNPYEQQQTALISRIINNVVLPPALHIHHDMSSDGRKN